jgi:hypothetical protein
VARTASAPPAPAAEGATFDPGDHTIAEVQTYVEANPDTAAAIAAAEQAGKARVTLLDWLAAR